MHVNRLTRNDIIQPFQYDSSSSLLSLLFLSSPWALFFCFPICIIPSAEQCRKFDSAVCLLSSSESSFPPLLHRADASRLCFAHFPGNTTVPELLDYLCRPSKEVRPPLHGSSHPIEPHNSSSFSSAPDYPRYLIASLFDSSSSLLFHFHLPVFWHLHSHSRNH